MTATCAIHPDTAATGVCPRCGSFICGRCELGPNLMCPACVKLLGAPAATELPWERKDQLGVARAFWEQTKLSIMKPGLYVASIRADRPWQEAFLFGWLASLVTGVLTVPYNTFNFWSQAEQLNRTLQSFRGAPPAPIQAIADLYSGLGQHPFAAAAGLMAFTVALYPLLLFLNAALAHVGLAMAGASSRQPFSATLRAEGYAMGVGVLTAIPFIGVLAALYLVFVRAWALRTIHRTTTWQAVVAVLWFGVLAGCCGGLAMMALVVRSLSALNLGG